MKLQESERTEFKSIVVTDIKKEIIAFANCDGGKIYIGIEDDGTVIGVEDSDSVALQVSNMVRDAIKPDLTMFLHYETKEIEQKQVVIIDIQRGTERPYYIAKKGLRPEGVYVRQGYSSVPATDTAIRKMIKETDGDHFEDMRSLDQELTFCETKKEFQKRNITLEQPQMKTLGIINQDGIYTNLALLLSDQCVHTIIVFPIPSRFDRILIPKISPITKSTPHNGAKIFANAFRSYFINFPSILRPLLCIHLYEISHGTGHRWICRFLLLSHQLTCMLQYFLL